MNRDIAIGLVLTGALTIALYQVKERARTATREVERIDRSIANERHLISAIEVQLAHRESETALAPAIERLNMVPMTVDREWTASELKPASSLGSPAARAREVPAANPPLGNGPLAGTLLTTEATQR